MNQQTSTINGAENPHTHVPSTRADAALHRENLPQRVSFADFRTRATITALIGHGRKAEVFFEGRSLSFVDALGDAGLAQAHKREINNALYFNDSEENRKFGVSLGADMELPSWEALSAYPDLREKFPTASLAVDRLEQALALGFSTAEQMETHEAWLAENGSPEYRATLNQAAGTSGPSDTKVRKNRIAVEFALPDEFGRGWEYQRQVTFPAGHAYGGSYDRTETGNFAHDALSAVKGLVETSMCDGMSCTVLVELANMKEEKSVMAALQVIVDAFPVRAERHIDIRGPHLSESRVDEYYDDREDYVVQEMPFLVYLIKHVPLSSNHPLLGGADPKAVLAKFDLAH